MKITIDTEHDSHDDIMKVMEILKHFVKKEEKTEIVDTTNMMSMFSNNSSPEQETKTSNEVPDTPPDFTSFLNLAQGKREDKRDDDPKIEFF